MLLSVGGVAYSIFISHKSVDAGRGGALAVALSFATLFLSRGYGDRVYSILTVDADTASQLVAKLRGEVDDKAKLVTADQKLDALFTKIQIDAGDQQVQNFYLAWSSVVGTIFWGFGDLLAIGAA